MIISARNPNRECVWTAHVPSHIYVHSLFNSQRRPQEFRGSHYMQLRYCRKSVVVIYSCSRWTCHSSFFGANQILNRRNWYHKYIKYFLLACWKLSGDAVNIGNRPVPRHSRLPFIFFQWKRTMWKILRSHWSKYDYRHADAHTGSGNGEYIFYRPKNYYAAHIYLFNFCGHRLDHVAMSEFKMNGLPPCWVHVGQISWLGILSQYYS